MSIGHTNIGYAPIRNEAPFCSVAFILRALGISVYALVVLLWLSKPTQVLAQSSVLLGEQTVETTTDSNVAGSAEAFQTTAAASGTLGSLTLYVDTSSNAQQLVMGLYASSGSNPGALLAQGSSSALSAGAWNTVSISPVNVTAGTLYWIAVLGTGGTLHFRDGGSSCMSQNSSQGNLTALPATWTRGPRWNTCRLSAYGSAASSATSSGQSNPVLSVSQSALSFNVTQGSNTNPPAGAINVTNTGGGTLSFTATSDSSWLAVGPASGAAPQSLQVSATLGSLTAGTYTGHITVAASGVQGSPASVTVTFNVAAAVPILSVSSTALSFSATLGSTTNPAAASVSVTNTGGGTLNFTASGDSSWLAVTPASGTAPQSLQVSATLGSLTAGTYTGHITVAASGVQGSPATVTVTFNVAAAAPILSVSSTALSFSATQGSGTGPAATAVNVTNTGGGTLSFTATSDSTWLAVTPASGIAPQSLQVSATLGSLTAGTYTGNITVTSPGVQGSPATIPVTFNVAAQSSVLLGQQTVETTADSVNAGTAEAFQTTATASGTLGSLTLYIDTSSTAQQLGVGLYASSGSNPGTLLAQGTISTLSPGAWNTVPVPVVNVTAGTLYWIAILGTGGTLHFRDGGSTCASQNSSQSNLTTLPASWSPGPQWTTCQLSAYGSVASSTSGQSNPILSVSQSTLSFSATQGSGTNPAATALNVTNTGSGTLNFTAASDSSWLAVTPTSGAAPQSLQVSATLGALTAGTYTGHITVAASGVQGSPGTVTVTFNVAAAAPVLSLSTSALSFNATQGSTTNPAATAVNVTNTGGGTLNFTASSDSSWLAVSPASGAAPQSLQVSATLGALTAGTYTGHITVAASGVQGSPATVTVTFNVAAQSTKTFKISGTISGSGGNAALVTLSGTANATVTASRSGAFTFSGQANGSYTVTPMKAGYTFSPAGQNVTVNGANVTVPGFTSAAQTYSISGTISGAGGNAAAVALNGAASASTTADGSGNYSFTGLANGSYSVAPSNPGFTFTPSSQAVAISGANAASINFTANPAYAISGTITPASVGSGATVTLSGTGTGTTTANSSGNFSFTSLNNGTYTITPSSSTATFSPTNQSVTVSGANVTGVSFTATPSASQNACGNTLSSASPTCQLIASGTLNPAWTVISRHGEYGQSETECNIPSAIAAGSSGLVITTSHVSYTCGDFDENGSVKTTAASWPYTTGDIQWNTFNFLYGTVTVRGKLPNINSDTWPSWWFMDSDCQNQNKYSGDPSGECPAYSTSTYREVDMIECLSANSNPGNWCNFTVHNGTKNPACTLAQAPLDANFHTYVMSWSSSSMSLTIDGASTGCTYTGAYVPTGPLFMIIQNQTSIPIGPPDNANLPTTFSTDFVQVQNPSGTVIFQDNFRPDIYFAQTAAGTGSGDDCTDARATSSMLAMDWVPGNTIHLCGALTSSITGLGGGTSSNPITVTFEPGAYFTASVWSSAINLNGFTNISVPTIPCGGPSCPN